jgi:hypothetical protein
MRLWSIHPRHLDAKGLVALWRETLLAKHVLQGRTKGYRHHPQLIRFKESKNALHAINQYLSIIYENSVERGYQFDKRKINWRFTPLTMMVTRGQIAYETTHLLKKLKRRDKMQFRAVSKLRRLRPHPIFRTVPGRIAAWEIT